jgi:hypothetical protein
METSLHRELKQRYAKSPERCEVTVAGFRIDAVVDDLLIEIQHGSLAAIRDKINKLLSRDHKVLIVKPLIVGKLLVKLDKKGGKVTSRRKSPKQEVELDLFHELVFFTHVFPHPNLTLEVPHVQIEEWRYPGHGRRRRWRKNDFQIEDQKLVSIQKTRRLQTVDDLWKLIRRPRKSPFHTGHLADVINAPRWVAQRVAYCLREMGAIDVVGKEGNAHLYKIRRSRVLKRCTSSA